MASGAAGERQKYYFFAREKNTGSPFLMEVFLLSRDREVAAEIRCGASLSPIQLLWVPDFLPLRQATRVYCLTLCAT